MESRRERIDVRKGFQSFLGVLLALVTLVGVVEAQIPLSPTIAILQANATAQGRGNVMSVHGYVVATVQITVTGSPTFTVNFESATGTNPALPPASADFASMNCTPLAGGADAPSASSTGLYRCNVSGT